MSKLNKYERDGIAKWLDLFEEGKSWQCPMNLTDWRHDVGTTEFYRDRCSVCQITFNTLKCPCKDGSYSLDDIVSKAKELLKNKEY